VISQTVIIPRVSVVFDLCMQNKVLKKQKYQTNEIFEMYMVTMFLKRIHNGLKIIIIMMMTLNGSITLVLVLAA